MKSLVTAVGIILIILGMGALGYERFTYTTEEKVAEIGNIQVTAENKKTVSIPPIVSGISIIAGLVLVVVGMKK